MKYLERQQKIVLIHVSDTKMFNINFISMLNQISYTYSKVSSSFVEVESAALSSLALFSLLLASLGLTFHTKGTTVHKVLGLLLTSIFVVFL